MLPIILFIHIPVFDLARVENGIYSSNNVVCATSKGSDQPAHTRSLIRTCASRLNIPSMNIEPLTKHRLEFLCLTGGCTGSSEPHCWKSHVAAHIYIVIFW